jgi:uncharacterized membrane protein
MVAYVLQHNERFLVNGDDPAWKHYEPFKWWLLPHALGGVCAIFLGPMQFSDRLRQRFTKLHRVVGRFYVGGVLVVGPLGFYIQYFNERIGEPRSFTFAALVNAILLIVPTAIAMGFILKGKVQQHRQWMTRSFAVALVFLEVRVIAGLTGYESEAGIETIVWICLGFSILAADIVIQWQEYRRVTPKRATVTA